MWQMVHKFGKWDTVLGCNSSLNWVAVVVETEWHLFSHQMPLPSYFCLALDQSLVKSTLNDVTYQLTMTSQTNDVTNWITFTITLIRWWRNHRLSSKFSSFRRRHSFSTLLQSRFRRHFSTFDISPLSTQSHWCCRTTSTSNYCRRRYPTSLFHCLCRRCGRRRCCTRFWRWFDRLFNLSNFVRLVSSILKIWKLFLNSDFI